MKFLRFAGSELVLGTLIAVLSVMTALASYQGATADSEQNKYEILGIQTLTDANAEYLTTNQAVIQDYTYFDNWYINVDVNPETADYYAANFSESLTAAMERGDYPFDEQYYEELYSEPNAMFTDAEGYFDVGAAWDERGDRLQLVVLVTAVGLAFAAWASLLRDESNMRMLFAWLSLVTLILGILSFVRVPGVAA